MSHSKRNTTRPVFTSHERAMAKAAWTSSSARLSRDSFLPFSSCSLCLEIARDPVACPMGDMFCRECALSNILAQRKEIKRLEKLREQEGRDALEAQAREDAEAQERAVREFEMVQAGFAVKGGQLLDPRRQTDVGTKQTTPSGTQESEGLKRVGKRKFELDDEELARIALEDRAKARRAIDDEKASKPTLPSFWTPSVAAAVKKNDKLHEIAKKVKVSPTCPAGPEDKPHHYSLNTLVTINFSEEKDEKMGTQQRICPSCKKGLSNTSKAVLAKPCGHVVCKSCVDKFMKPTGQHDPHSPDSDPHSVRCYVCDADLTEKKPKEKPGKKEKEKIRPGLVALRSDGTGFSAGGTNEVKKNSTVFQC